MSIFRDYEIREAETMQVSSMDEAKEALELMGINASLKRSESVKTKSGKIALVCEFVDSYQESFYFAIV